MAEIKSKISGGRTFCLGFLYKGRTQNSLGNIDTSTFAGKALTKHPNIVGANDSGSGLSKIGLKTHAQKNIAAANKVRDFMDNGTVTVKFTKDYGWIVDYKMPNAHGARFKINGTFIGFLGRHAK